jgi:hypothetical protein
MIPVAPVERNTVPAAGDLHCTAWLALMPRMQLTQETSFLLSSSVAATGAARYYREFQHLRRFQPSTTPILARPCLPHPLDRHSSLSNNHAALGLEMIAAGNTLKSFNRVLPPHDLMEPCSSAGTFSVLVQRASPYLYSCRYCFVWC